jgi:3-deoxy-D-manno-octulosonic-acid transferase
VPALFIILIFNGKYRKEIFYKLPQRFVKWDYPSEKNLKKTVWVHCSSLGEIRAVEPVLDLLKKKYNIILTSITKTGKEYAEKIQKADFTALLPLDLYPFMMKAFKTVKPDLLILVETELWVSMLYAADKQKVKIMTVNGRMSEKSFKIYNTLKFFWERFIGLIDVVLARSSDDAGRFMVFAGSKTQVYVSGNIKYDRDFAVKSSRVDFGLDANDKVFTAGSIREGEDAVIADAYIKIREKMPDIYFFAAPRHLSKIKNVKNTLKDKKIEYLTFSEMLKGKKPNKRFILIDVFGKLQEIYSISDVCFVGGSIIKKGGQNPIEPAACAKPVLFGKNMDNFKTEAEILLQYGGGITVFDGEDIVAKIEKLFLNREFLTKTGENALKAVKSQKGALNITVNAIKEQLK